MMPEVSGDPPSPRAAIFWNETEWQWALVDAQGHLQIDALSTVMDPLAATAAAQALALAQLQLIEDMRDALQSVATDRLIVRGEDQLFTLKGVLANTKNGAVSGANGYYDSHAVPDGEYWIVTTIGARNDVRAGTRVLLNTRHDGVNSCIHDEIRAFVAGERATWSGHTYLDKDDVIRATFIGAQAGDTCYVDLTGYRMTVEA